MNRCQKVSVIDVKSKRHLILIGFMATGKSTLGAELAQQSKLSFIDLDEEIERAEGISIAEIFAIKGEGYFRSIETDVLRSFMMNHTSPLVLATGGGAVLKAENRQLMVDHGFIVKTEASRNEVIRRLKNEPLTRPLLIGELEKRVDRHLKERQHAYDFADLVIHTDQMEKSEAAKIVLSAWYGKIE